MEKYVRYLLHDIRAAIEHVPDLLVEPDEDTDYLPAEEEEKYAPRQRLSDRLGLRPEWFPPPSRLGDAQMDRLVNALEDSLEAHGYFVIFPEATPMRQRYEMLTEKLDSEVPVLQYNVWQIELCDYEPEQCPFGEGNCRCRDIEALLSDPEFADEIDWDDNEEWNADDYWPGEEEEGDYLEPGLDISGYDMPELFFGAERFPLWSEDELDLHGRSRPARSNDEDEERSPDEFASPDYDPDDEDGED